MSCNVGLYNAFHLTYGQSYILQSCIVQYIMKYGYYGYQKPGCVHRPTCTSAIIFGQGLLGARREATL